MSLTLIPGRNTRPARKHRAIDRLAQRETELCELRQRLDDADQLILRQAVRLTELETANAELGERLQQREDALLAVGRDRAALERYARELEGQVADAERLLDVRTWAEAATAKTQEMPVIEVVSLRNAPFATVDPGRIR